MDQILPFFPQAIATYFEPFIGGGAIFFRLSAEGRFRRARISDFNPEIVEVYLVVRDQPEELCALLANHVEKHAEKFFYDLRNVGPLFLNSWSPVERAARTIYINKATYNGLYRQNMKGEMNASWGKHDKPSVYSRENVMAVSRALADVEILCADFASAVSSAQAGDFAYFDPPYLPVSATSFTTYTGNDFAARDHRRLAELAIELSDRGAGVVISNSDCSLAREIFAAFELHTIAAKRAINNKGDGRGAVSEIVAVRTPCSERKATACS